MPTTFRAVLGEPAIYASVSGVCLPWLGESSGLGLAPWRMVPFGVHGGADWPYGDQRGPSVPSGGHGRPVGARRALPWFTLDSEGVCGDFLALSGLPDSGSMALSHGTVSALIGEIEAIRPHLTKLDALRFELAKVLLDKALNFNAPDITAERLP